MHKLMNLAGAFLALAIVGCTSGRTNTRPVSQPQAVVVTQTANVASSNGRHAWTQGDNLYFKNNFFGGYMGAVRIRGNFGRNGISWGVGYTDCISQQGDASVVDITCYTRTGRMLRDNFYCLTATSGDGNTNWLNNAALAASEAYMSRRGEPNIAIYIDRDGHPHVANSHSGRSADIRRKLC